MGAWKIDPEAISERRWFQHFGVRVEDLGDPEVGKTAGLLERDS